MPPKQGEGAQQPAGLRGWGCTLPSATTTPSPRARRAHPGLSLEAGTGLGPDSRAGVGGATGSHSPHRGPQLGEMVLGVPAGPLPQGQPQP